MLKGKLETLRRLVRLALRMVKIKHQHHKTSTSSTHLPAPHYDTPFFLSQSVTWQLLLMPTWHLKIMSSHADDL